ncbi:hypothetical protein TRAPUB_12597 [Trametes pubescens]|uniref:Uncharacterized protein n=1 Tax=Trametes pubescens TaxID=154538 RepID=A0A1M2VTD8_TRAPU|nr:hypothetical protein TRAPUB_12597 [Trametes pubescens]
MPEIVQMSEFGSLADGWNSSPIECERIMEGVHPYTGVLPAVVVVPGAGFASIRRPPIYRWVCDDCKPLGALERTLMQDVVWQMCMRIVNGAFVMCASPDSRRDNPDVGISDPGHNL